MNKSAHTEKNIFFLLILAIAFVIFLVFINNQDTIAENGQTELFVFFATVGLALLAAFVYLISNRGAKSVKKVASKSSKSKKRKR